MSRMLGHCDVGHAECAGSGETWPLAPLSCLFRYCCGEWGTPVRDHVQKWFPLIGAFAGGVLVLKLKDWFKRLLDPLRNRLRFRGRRRTQRGRRDPPRGPACRGAVERALTDGRLAVHFDGLDEVPTPQRPRIAAAIRQFMNVYDRCRAVVTCRVAVYRGEFGDDAIRP